MYFSKDELLCILVNVITHLLLTKQKVLLILYTLFWQNIIAVAEHALSTFDLLLLRKIHHQCTMDPF